MGGPASSPLRIALLAAVALAVALFGLALEGRPELAEAREVLRGREVPVRALGSQRTGKMLRWMERIHPRYVSGSEGTPPPGGRWRRLYYTLEPESPGAMPSTAAADPELVARGVPILSVAVGRRDYGSLLAKRFQRGRAAERQGYVSYFDDGRLLFASGAGVRLHGGMSRLISPVKSLRLYFREALGAPQFPAGLLFDEGSEPLRRVIVHNDVRTDHFGDDWHFVRPLAFDVAERVGAPVPRVSPALFVLNGELQGAAVLTEYLNRHYLESHYGHDNFVMVREKKNPGDEPLKLGTLEPYDDLWRWLRRLGRAPEMDVVGQRIDIDNLTSWFVAVLYCGASDSLQGPVLLDETDPDARWFWIVWDMDHSFKVDWGWQPGDETWDVDTFYSILVLSGTQAKRDVVKLRSYLLRTLLRRGEYKLYLQRRLQEALNHQLTPEFLGERLEHYASVARELGVDNSAFESTLEPFFEHRGRVLREQMARHQLAGPSHAVSVTAPAGCDLAVDGHRYGSAYSGAYFEGTKIRLRPLAGCRQQFSHWRIEGGEEGSRDQRNLVLTVTAPLTIEAVVEDRQAAGSGAAESALGWAP